MKIAFVVPRYFKNIVGGAETLIGSVANKLSERGDVVEIFTTCAKDNRSWVNEFKVGTEIVNGVPVNRYPVDDRDLDKWIPKQLAIHDGFKISVPDQLEWMSESVNSSDLFQALLKNRDNFDCFIFGPSLFGTSFWGAQLMPEKSILLPCLHNEPSAYLEVTHSLFRSVKGCIFNCKAEQKLAEEIFGNIKGADVGLGFEYEEKDQSPYFPDEFPYLMYLGRKETGKNAHLLLDDFIALKDDKRIPDDLKLVICGGGSFTDLLRPQAFEREDIIDLCNVSEDEKQSLLRYALALVQPSLNESFSIVMMESWLEKTPVIVHADCPVTREHVIDSGGGLYYANRKELEVVINLFLTDKEFYQKASLSGKEYVEKEYSWGAVLNRFDIAIQKIFT